VPNVTPEEQREHDERNREGTRKLIDSLMGQVAELRRERDEAQTHHADTVEAGFGHARVRGPLAIVLPLVIGVVVLGAGAWAFSENQRQHRDDAERMQKAHRVIVRQTLVARDELRVLACISALLPEERVKLREKPNARQALIGYCPGLFNDFQPLPDQNGHEATTP
jgi:hypothetical protein